jgi:asparagine synthase (glutamine-hydrolysing)
LFFSQKEEKISGLFKPGINNPNFPLDWYRQNYFKNIDQKDFTSQFMRVDTQTWLPDESLLRSDKMSMAVGLEERVPFLDHRLVEYAANIPLKYKLGSKGLSLLQRGRGYQGKKILKDAFSDCLPDFVLNQPKWGWFSPAAKWLRGPLKKYAEEVLSASYNRGTAEMFDFNNIQERLQKHLNKESYELNTIWAMMTFQVWYKKFVENY